ncbi:GreA/GreB family elongation factor [Clostridium sp. FP2]|uniref:GreA/GreB family elongation factor n=1 Tax=Clostridium sp. FP2 TaxID=2724481 RepID=UPI0013E945CE|nr:GreA/GreB family elongation factor [Clostridium sp. FP2]MBZ9623242.1 GreA/GreB family elongation factor [Clostridium sp. FP2]
MGIKNMQGTSAFIEYLRLKEDHRRSKRNCKYYKNGICVSKTARFMTKCTSPTFCSQYKEKNDIVSEKLNTKTNLKTVKLKESMKIKLYSNVKIMDYSMDEIIKVILVPRNESDAFNNKISTDSELGAALLGKSKGNIIKLNFISKKGVEGYKYKILEFD